MVLFTRASNIYSMFLFKERNMLTFFGFMRLLLCDIKSPALENKCSEGTEVAVMHKYFLASLTRVE